MQTATKPLSGKRILVTRPSGRIKSLSQKLRNLGATTIEIPTIKIEPPSDTIQIDNSIKNLSKYDWIIFTSVHGVEFFLQRMKALQTPMSSLNIVRIAAIGSATAGPLERVGRRPDYIPPEFLSEQIANGLGNLQGKRILLPRANIASKKLPLQLRDRGAQVEEIVAYRTVRPHELDHERLMSTIETGIDIVTFTSPSTVHHFAAALRHAKGKFLSNVRVACIGPVTSEAARKVGMKVHVVAKPHTIDALIEGIVNDVRNL